MSRNVVVRRRRWPLHFELHLNRCREGYFTPEPDYEFIVCNGILWPWQDVIREWDPECGGPWVHHACHHRYWQSSNDMNKERHPDMYDPERWREFLSCEHGDRFTDGR